MLSQAIAASRAGDTSVRRLAAGERRTHASRQGQPEDNDRHRIPARRQPAPSSDAVRLSRRVAALRAA